MTVNTDGINQGPAGSDLTWDFSDLESETAHTVTYLSPSAAPSSLAAEFSDDSNLAIRYEEYLPQGSIQVRYEFFNNTSAGLYQTGITNVGNVIVHYDNPLTVLSYPFEFVSTDSDNFSATYSSGTFNISRTGSISHEGDGTGDLLLPGGITVFDAVRVRSVIEFVDEIEESGITFNYTVERYTWYDESSLFPIFTIYTEQLDGSGSGAPITSAYYYQDFMDTDPIGLNEANDFDFALNTAPNPTTGLTNISYELNTPATTSLEVYGIDGRMVRTFTPTWQSAGTYNTALNLSDQPKGMYFVRLRVDGKDTYSTITLH